MKIIAMITTQNRMVFKIDGSPSAPAGSMKIDFKSLSGSAMGSAEGTSTLSYPSRN